MPAQLKTGALAGHDMTRAGIVHDIIFIAGVAGFSKGSQIASQKPKGHQVSATSG